MVTRMDKVQALRDAMDPKLVVLIDIAAALALMIREGVIKRDGYEKGLRTWIMKNIPESERPRLLRAVEGVLQYEKIAVALRPRNW